MEHKENTWYKHTQNEHEKWRVFLNNDEKTYSGFGINGKPFKNTENDADIMFDYVDRHCIKCSEEECLILDRKDKKIIS